MTVRLEQTAPQASDYKISQELLDLRLYQKPLTDIGQPLICHEFASDRREWYRFLWVPTFDHPVFIRVDIERDGTAALVSNIWDGQGGYEWGKPVRNLRKLTLEEENVLFATLADIGFWSLPAKVEYPSNVVVLDGTEWLIEGVRDGKCHAVTRYSSPLTELVERQFLATIAKLKPQ